ncbi:MAG TPA: YdeI/OmpD-associated family protein [Thermoanaerobaculia bacterium]|nr:YdeI/OmpD-associated family protein [Thermoanaerobaculia bacterium]
MNVDPAKMLYVPTRAAWRKWLAKNHDRVAEIWLIYPKKDSGEPRVSYNDAVEEALCFGWIDGMTKSLDENRYMQRFSPRRADSNWSESNRKRYARLLSEGHIAAPGLAKPPNENRPAAETYQRNGVVPAYIEHAFKKDKEAHAKWMKIPLSHLMKYVAWIDSAKREETRTRRIAEAIRMLKDGVSINSK